MSSIAGLFAADLVMTAAVSANFIRSAAKYKYLPKPKPAEPEDDPAELTEDTPAEDAPEKNAPAEEPAPEEKKAPAKKPEPKKPEAKKKPAPRKKDAKKAPEPQQPQPTTKENVLSLLSTIFTVIVVMVGAADILGISTFSGFRGAFAAMAVTVVIEMLCDYVLRSKSSRLLRFAQKIALAALVLELTVFQFPSYHLLFGGYEKKTIKPGDGYCENVDSINGDGSISASGAGEVLISFEELGMKVGTVHANIKYDGKADNIQKINFIIDAADATHEEMRYDVIRGEIVSNNPDSAYVTALMSGDIRDIRFKFTGTSGSQHYTVESIELNVMIPFTVSWLRYFLIVILGTFLYGMLNSALLLAASGKTRRLCKVAAAVITVISLTLAIEIVFKELPDGGLKKQFELRSGDQITEEIVTAFEAGQVSLTEKPTAELMALDDPYDWGVRDSSGAYYRWDHVYYDGKYYSYYGIAPVVLLFLPYHKITGNFFSTNIAVLIFCLIGLIFLTMTYDAIMKRWFRKIPAGCYIAGLIMLHTVCGIWFCAGRTIFYEISISSGFAFTTLGAFFLISSNVISKGKTSPVKAFLASLFLATAVLCRPTLAVYSVCACIYYLFGLKKASTVTTAEGTTSRSIPRGIIYAVCALLPFIVLGSVQMWYNYARFGSPLDFGIQYSLTINDFVDSQYHTHFVLIGLFNYLIAFPSIIPEYPYVTTPYYRLGANGYYFSDVGNTSGIFWLALPVFGYFLAGRALRRLPDRKTRLKWLTLIGLPCVVMPLVIICSIWESGYAVRYVADFSWEILMGAFAVLFFLYTTSRNETLKKLFRLFMGVSVIAALVINIPQIYHFSLPASDYPELSTFYTQVIEFWK